MLAAVVCDDWKLPVFRKRLKLAGFDFDEIAGPMPGVYTLKVRCGRISDMKPIIDAAESECRKRRAH